MKPSLDSSPIGFSLKWVAILALLFGGSFFFTCKSHAQNLTTVTGTVIDSDGQTWNGGSITARLVVPGGTGAVYATGGTVPPVTNLVMSNTGVISGQLPNANAIIPPGVTQSFFVCSLTSGSNACQTVGPVSISGSTMDLGTIISSRIAAIRMEAAKENYAYNTTEILDPVQGTGYTNLSDPNNPTGWFYNQGTGIYTEIGSGIPSTCTGCVLLNPTNQVQVISSTTQSTELELSTNLASTAPSLDFFNGQAVTGNRWWRITTGSNGGIGFSKCNDTGGACTSQFSSLSGAFFNIGAYNGASVNLSNTPTPCPAGSFPLGVSGTLAAANCTPAIVQAGAATTQVVTSTNTPLATINTTVGTGQLGALQVNCSGLTAGNGNACASAVGVNGSANNFGANYFRYTGNGAATNYMHLAVTTSGAAANGLCTDASGFAAVNNNINSPTCGDGTHTLLVNGSMAGTTQTLTANAPTVPAGQIGYGAQTVAATNCNNAGTLTKVNSCMVVNVGGTTLYVALFVP